MDQIIELLNTFQGFLIAITVVLIIFSCFICICVYQLIDMHYKELKLKEDLKYDLEDFKLLEQFKDFQNFKKGK